MKVMVAFIVVSIVVLMDLQRQKQNLIASRNRQAKQAVIEFAASLQSWLGTPNTISFSFGEESATGLTGVPNRVQVILYQDTNPTDLDSIQNDTADVAVRSSGSPTTPPDDYSIRHLVLTDGTSGIIVLQRGSVEGVALMGPPPLVAGADIRSLDSAGWVYIRDMWIDNYQGFTRNLDGTLPSGDSRWGRATLRVLIWRFTNLIDRTLDCTTQNNCLHKVISIPLDIRVSQDLVTRQIRIEQGSYGLDCGNIVEAKVNDASSFPDCSDTGSSFQKFVEEDTDSDGHADTFWGRCCRPVGELELLD